MTMDPPKTLAPDEVMHTGWGSGPDLTRSPSPGDRVWLTLGPFETQRNRAVT
jgi:hypothetical protein